MRILAQLSLVAGGADHIVPFPLQNVMRIEQYGAILARLSQVAGCADHIVRRNLQNLMRIENYGAIPA